MFSIIVAAGKQEYNFYSYFYERFLRLNFKSYI
jgi:hypothetical protein